MYTLVVQKLRDFSFGFFILFRNRETKFMKITPPESSLEFSNSQNYENIDEHLLIRSHIIHKSVTYQALFSLLFKLVKNEEILKLDLLDSLKLNKKRKE